MDGEPVVFVFVLVAVVAGVVMAIKWIANALAVFWTGVVQMATYLMTVIGVVICVLGGLAALVALVYVLGTFAERLYRLRLGARHQRERLAMEWDQLLIKNYPEGPEDFDG